MAFCEAINVDLRTGRYLMPAYEFKCQACDKIFTLILKVAELEEGKAACPHCNSGKVTQVLSSFFAKTSRKS